MSHTLRGILGFERGACKCNASERGACKSIVVMCEHVSDDIWYKCVHDSSCDARLKSCFISGFSRPLPTTRSIQIRTHPRAGIPTIMLGNVVCFIDADKAYPRHNGAACSNLFWFSAVPVASRHFGSNNLSQD